jgi:hypothetical protein
MHWAQGILADARRELSAREPERMEDHNNRLSLAREAMRAGEKSAIRMAQNFGITEGQAVNIINRAAGRSSEMAMKKLSAVAEARQYAATHDVTGYRLRKMFDLSLETARRIAKEANDGNPTRLEVLQENHKKALTHAYSVGGRISPRELAEMFGFGQQKAREILVDVAVDIKRRDEAARQKPTRIVRRFRDISGTDMTSDRVRFPSGIGFAVLEVVR